MVPISMEKAFFYSPLRDFSSDSENSHVIRYPAKIAFWARAPFRFSFVYNNLDAFIMCGLKNE